MFISYFKYGLNIILRKISILNHMHTHTYTHNYPSMSYIKDYKETGLSLDDEITDFSYYF